MSSPTTVHKCTCKLNVITNWFISNQSVYHETCDGYINEVDDVETVISIYKPFMNLRKYDLGDVVTIKDAEYIVDQLYENGQAEKLVCNCDTNCRDKLGKTTSTCFNCSADRVRLDDDEDGNADWEWVNGFTDLMTIYNFREIEISQPREIKRLKVRIA